MDAPLRTRMGIDARGYIGVRARDLDDWAGYGSNFLGLQRIDKSRSTLAFRMDDRKQRLLVDADGGQGIDQESLFAVIHTERKGRAALVDALQAEEVAAVACPVVQIPGANPDIAPCVNAHAGS